MFLTNLNADIVARITLFKKSRHKPNLESTSKYGFPPISAISFPEPTCLLVSTKTGSSGIINFQRPRFQGVPWLTWRLEIKSMWMRSTKNIQYSLEKLGKSNFGFERTTVSEC